MSNQQQRIYDLALAEAEKNKQSSTPEAYAFILITPQDCDFANYAVAKLGATRYKSSVVLWLRTETLGMSTQEMIAYAESFAKSLRLQGVIATAKYKTE